MVSIFQLPSLDMKQYGRGCTAKLDSHSKNWILSLEVQPSWHGEIRCDDDDDDDGDDHGHDDDHDHHHENENENADDDKTVEGLLLLFYFLIVTLAEKWLFKWHL